jgi:hypothetical protein
MGRAGERGEGKLAGILWLAFFAGVIYALFHVGPVYYDHYNLVDKMNEMARAPKWSHNDDKIFDLLTKFTREEGMSQWVKRNNFTVTTMDTSRRISVDYERPADILPGVKHVFRFSKIVEAPLI